jgi:hypothetical protein
VTTTWNPIGSGEKVLIFIFCLFFISDIPTVVFPSIVGNLRVALLQPPEEPFEPVASSRPAKRKNEIVDLTETGKAKRKRQLKAISNRKQSEKRKNERERIKEANASLTPREKEELARGIMEREKDWEILNLYDKDNEVNWSTGKKMKIWTEEEGGGENDLWDLNRLPRSSSKLMKTKK